jgi:hypothetical protein
VLVFRLRLPPLIPCRLQEASQTGVAGAHAACAALAAEAVRTNAAQEGEAARMVEAASKAAARKTEALRRAAAGVVRAVLEEEAVRRAKADAEAARRAVSFPNALGGRDGSECQRV